MIGIFPAIFAASLIAVAAAASESFHVVGRAAPLALFQARGSGLVHARQNDLFPDSCASLCDPIAQTIDVSTTHTQAWFV